MTTTLGKCCKIGHIVRLLQMLQRWRNKAAATSTTQRSIPSDVPAGHIAVTVGTSRRRFIVPAKYLNHPAFEKLLVQAEEEYGFANQVGPLYIPCDESLFEDILQFLSRSDSNRFEDFQRTNCRGLAESRPLLHKFIC